ncbi:MAG: DUF1553 domain-containing protein [Planctomycetes bacterium]|nr:DUF1553 domain-containing protein [Planctomycetota bacterium]
MLRALTTSLALVALAAAQAPTRHWSFTPPQRVASEVDDDAWCRDDLDRCVLAELERRGEHPSPEAAPEVLLRRLHLVLTGLGPSPGDVAAFVAEPSDAAYRQTVDRLLASDACAEHRAVAWLDLARFADTYGYQSDYTCRTWPWRDWLLRALHRDLPWPRFVEQVVAGDLLADAGEPGAGGGDDARIATAFWRLHRQTNEGGSIDEEWRHEYVADRVDTFGQAFLGLTLGCARCHDHKSDPIRQRDFYATGSFFAVDEAGLTPYSTGGTPQPAMRLGDAAAQRELQRLAAAEADAERALAAALRVADSTPVHELAAPAPVAQHGRFVGDGDRRVGIDKPPTPTRADPYSLRFVVTAPTDAIERAVLVHTSNYTEDADTQGFQVLLKHDRLCWEVVHHWPGSAIAVATRTSLPGGRAVQVVVTYDGSSRAAGLAIWLDGERADVAVVRDELRGPATVRRLELGGRDRDRGFAGTIDEFAMFDRELDGAEIATLCRRAATDDERRDHARRHAPAVAAARDALRQARRAHQQALEQLPELMVMAAHPHPAQRFVLRRGAYDQPDTKQPVDADVPAAVLPFDASWPRDRRGLARWLNAPEQPLAARVVVDRLWAQCFGEGLIPTPNDLGRAGEAPLHQHALDLLACDLQRSGSTREILRRIVCSATFRQASTTTAERHAADPHNRLLARGPSFRLSAEALRDHALLAAGLLRRTVGGPSCRPWQPPGLWRDSGAAWGGGDYQPDGPAGAHRRSLYTFVKRTAPPPDMVVFDAQSRETCLVRRQPTDTPLQALTIWNDPVFGECAEALARRAELELPQRGLASHVDFVFGWLCGRAPRDAERDALLALCAQAADERQGLALCASTLLGSDAVMVVR